MSSYETRETRYETRSVDRREAYYEKAAKTIARDRHAYYRRIEKGLAWLRQQKWASPQEENAGAVVSNMMQRVMVP
jgi:hypothetical protein